MKRLLLILSAALMFAFAGCESFGGDDVVGGSYNMSGAIQKGPFVQGSNITIQPLNSNLKPIGQMYTTQTTNDAGMFEMEGVNSKYAEIIATGYYYDEVEGKISASPLTLRSIADLKDGTQTNVNLLTSLTYNRIKNLVTNNGKGISEAQEQAEKELFAALGIPTELQPNVSCGAMNIANNGEGDGLLLALSAILQEGRSVGELTEYISKFATDLADDGMVETALLEKFNLDGQHLLRFEERINEHLTARYESLGVDCAIPDFSKYLPYFVDSETKYFIIPFTYKENDVTHDGIEKFTFSADTDFLGYRYYNGYGEIYLSATPVIIYSCQCDVLLSITLPDSVIEIGAGAFSFCSSLVDITIPESVVIIGAGAFEGCSSLANVYCKPTTPPTGFYDMWGYWSLFCPYTPTPRIYVPSESVNIYQYAEGWNMYAHSILAGDFEFEEVNPEYCKIYYTSTDGKIVQPENVEGFGAKIISNTYEDGQGVILFDSKVTSIAERAFNFVDNDNLKSIVIPASVTSIGVGVFEGCESLESVSIPNSVSSIGGYAFCYCLKLADITLPVRLTAIEEGTFEACKSLPNITIPDSVTSIGKDAFSNCSSFTNITIPDSVTSSIGAGAFQYCVSLESIVIGNNVTSIDNYTFVGCENLKNVTIGSLCNVIGNGAFSDCTSLTNINLPNVLLGLREHTFCGCTSLESITIPSSVEYIDMYAFGECSSLAEFYCKSTIPPTINNLSLPEREMTIYVPVSSLEAYKMAKWWSNRADSIVPYDFSENRVVDEENCKIYYTSTDGNVVNPCVVLDMEGNNNFGANIVSNTYENGKGVITFDGEVTQIGYSAFGDIGNGSNLASIVIPDSVTEIGEYAFSPCSTLESITIGKGVTSIGRWAFLDCENLKDVYIKDIAAWCNIEFAQTDNGLNIYNCNPLSRANLYLNGVLVEDLVIPDSVTKINNWAFLGCNSIKSVTIGRGVITIGNRAFKNCSNLESITIPDSVTEIGQWAFYECANLKSVEANCVYNIGERAFERCTSLEYANFPQVGNIYHYAFYGCTSLKTINISSRHFYFLGTNVFHFCESLTSIDIPYGVQNIPQSSFVGCTNLTSVNIPISVTCINYQAFQSCTSLSSVTIPASVTELSGSVFNNCTNLTEVYCRPTTPPTGWSKMFSNNAVGRKIYVPTASVEKYKTAKGWSEYADDIVGYDFGTVPTVKMYVYNAIGWKPLNVYLWDSEYNAPYIYSWPGVEVTEMETINGHDYYVYEVPSQAINRVAGIIFNNGTTQTSDWFITLDKDYYLLLDGSTTPKIIEDINNPVAN